MDPPVRDVPVRLGRYEIVERLAAGGMGEVFVARAYGVGGFIKPVALKRIHPHLATNEAFIHMLHDEANVAASIRHPNIVGTLDVGVDGDSHFVVMDFACGDPLNRVLRELRKRGIAMPPWIVAWIGAQTASALHAAHEAKNLSGERLEIVHRDVSLANIMLSDAGHPMLFDFGVAKAKQRIHQTTHGELKGKLCYMAPEIFRGEAVDRTVDVFGLGVVLYELLTAKSPFQRGSDLETIAALQSGDIPRPSQLVARIDPALDEVVLKAMNRERSARYATAAEVEVALRDWARESGSPHDAGAVQKWLEATFPERIAARRALLSRVASPGEVTIVEPMERLDGGTPISGPLSGPLGVAGRTPAGRPSRPTPSSPGGTPSSPGATPSSPSGAGSSPGMPSSPGSAPGVGAPGLVAAGFGATPAPGSIHTVAGIAVAGQTGPSGLMTLPARRSRAPIFGAVLGAVVGVVGVVVWMTKGEAPASGVGAPTDATGVAASPGPATAAPTVEPAPAASAVASAEPTASAAPTSSAAAPAPSHTPAAKKAPSKGADPKPPTKKGPLVRTYD